MLIMLVVIFVYKTVSNTRKPLSPGFSTESPPIFGKSSNWEADSESEAGQCGVTAGQKPAPSPFQVLCLTDLSHLCHTTVFQATALLSQ